MAVQENVKLAVELAKHVCAPTEKRWWGADEIDEFIATVSASIQKASDSTKDSRREGLL